NTREPLCVTPPPTPPRIQGGEKAASRACSRPRIRGREATTGRGVGVALHLKPHEPIHLPFPSVPDATRARRSPAPRADPAVPPPTAGPGTDHRARGGGRITFEAP